MITIRQMCETMTGEALQAALMLHGTVSADSMAGDYDPGIPDDNSVQWIVLAWDDGKLTDDQYEQVIDSLV